MWKTPWIFDPGNEGGYFFLSYIDPVPAFCQVTNCSVMSTIPLGNIPGEAWFRYKIINFVNKTFTVLALCLCSFKLHYSLCKTLCCSSSDIPQSVSLQRACSWGSCLAGSLDLALRFLMNPTPALSAWMLHAVHVLTDKCCCLLLHSSGCMMSLVRVGSHIDEV